MHMTDALLSPAVGGAMTVVSAAAIGYSAKKIRDDRKIPMMGVMGAFVFAAQMVNFTIPATGSSGHISGGVLLAAVLGPFPALVTMASVLLMQCLFFADGGLLAYGCNVFNMGVCACLIAYPLVFAPFVKGGMSRKTITLASMLASVLALQLGAFCVVVETTASGVAGLPFGAFAMLMQPIHLAIGIVEGTVTAAVLCFVHNSRPGILNRKPAPAKLPLVVLTAVLIGASLFASAAPDGLEWSLEKFAAAEPSGVVYDAMERIVDATAFMPDYNGGTVVAGVIGVVITAALVSCIGIVCRKRGKYGTGENILRADILADGSPGPQKRGSTQ